MLEQKQNNVVSLVEYRAAQSLIRTGALRIEDTPAQILEALGVSRNTYPVHPPITKSDNRDHRREFTRSWPNIEPDGSRKLSHSNSGMKARLLGLGLFLSGAGLGLLIYDVNQPTYPQTVAIEACQNKNKKPANKYKAQADTPVMDNPSKEAFSTGFVPAEGIVVGEVYRTNNEFDPSWVIWCKADPQKYGFVNMKNLNKID